MSSMRGRALAARDALAAGFVLQMKFMKKLRDLDTMHVSSSMTTRPPEPMIAPTFLSESKSMRQVHVLLGQAAAGRAADLHGLELFAVLDAAADVVDDLAQRRAHGHLDQAGVVDVAGEGEGLRAGAALGADGLEPVRALLDDVGHVGKRLDVVQARWACRTGPCRRCAGASCAACRGCPRWTRSAPLPSPQTNAPAPRLMCMWKLKPLPRMLSPSKPSSLACSMATCADGATAMGYSART